jgi:WD repeat-containing protein 20
LHRLICSPENKLCSDAWFQSTQMTVAYLKEKPAGQGSAPSTPSSGSGMRSVAARFLGSGNGGSRALSFAGGNGVNRAVAGTSRVGGGLGTSTGLGGSLGTPNYDGKGTYIIFNSADSLFISNLNSQDKVFLSLVLD